MSTTSDPVLSSWQYLDRTFPVLVWPMAEPMRVASTAVLGGGIGVRTQMINAQVPNDYAGTDVVGDLERLASSLGFQSAESVGMLTAVDVRRHHCGSDGGVRAVATVGITVPTWAADATGDRSVPEPGTINVLVAVPAPLTDAALVNMVATATEAKTQAFREAGVPGTGTASDAVAVACRLRGEPDLYGGPRSLWGARAARAVHGAVSAGLARKRQ